MSLELASDDETAAEVGMPEQRRLGELLATARWLAESTVRKHLPLLAVIAVAQVIGAVGTAFGTLGVIFYIRAAVGDGGLGAFPITVESAAEPRTAVIFLVVLLTIICFSAWAIWRSEQAIADLAKAQASRLRRMMIALLEDPASEGWPAAIDHRRPAVALHQAMVSKVRSSTVAITELLALGPALVTLLVSLAVMILIDPFATLIAVPIAAVFGVIGERINREVQNLTLTYDSRLEGSRNQLVDRLEDLASGRSVDEEQLFARTKTDDQLFHDRQLATTKLQVLGLVNSALMFAAIVAYFIIVRGVEGLSIELIIAYTFAIRFAARSVQQVFKAFVQVSRRMEDIKTVQAFIAAVDAHRVERTVRRERSAELPSTMTVNGADGDEVSINRRRPVLVLVDRPPDEQVAREVLQVVERSSQTTQLDLVSQARIMEWEPDTPVPDILAKEPVRVLISDTPLELLDDSRQAFAFIVHNRPKMVFAKAVRDRASSFGGVLVVVGDELAWSGSVDAAAEAEHDVRELLKRRRSGARRASTQRDIATH